MRLTGDAKGNKVLRTLAWIALSLGAILALSLLIAWMAFTIQAETGDLTGNYLSSPSAPWPTIYSVAESEARKQEPDVVPCDFVSASPPFDSTLVGITSTIELEIDIYFCGPSGAKYRIEVFDADPASTVALADTDTRHREEDAEYAAFRREFYDLSRVFIEARPGWYTDVKITPRDALRITWPEMQSTANQNGVSQPWARPFISDYHFMSQAVRERADHLIWNIQYDVIEASQVTNIGLPAGKSLSITFEVDGISGEIVSRKIKDR